MIDLSTHRIPSIDDLYGINQLYGLYDLIKDHFDENTYLCEIGSYNGVSTSLFASMCGKVVAIDKRKLPLLHEVDLKYDNLTIIKAWSEDVINDFKDEEFDAVYIDAKHDYEYVKQNIIEWIPKIKQNGILCGHDYMDDELIEKIKPDESMWKRMGCNGVRKAVDELFSNVRCYKDSSWAVQL